MSLTYTPDLIKALKAKEAELVANAKQDIDHKIKSGHAEKKKSGHTKPKAPTISLDQPGRLRVAHLLAILSVSHATLYAGIKKKRYPPATGHDGKIPYWSTSVIKEFLEG